MSDFEISIAKYSELESVAEMFDLYRQFYEQKSDMALATNFIGARMQKDESIILMARNTDGHDAGFCQLYPSFCSVSAVQICVLYDLFVRPEFRRFGVGRALLLAAEELAKSRNVVRMDLTTAKDNFKAQALYESLGWIRDEVFYTYNRQIS